MRAPSLAGTELDRYFHVCALFDNREEEYQVLAPFIDEGLVWGEKELHIVDPALRRDHQERLTRAGIDAASYQARGQLDIRGWDEAYLHDGRFDKDHMLETVDEVLASGRRDGYPRSRIMGNMRWAFESVPGVDQLIEYESAVNDVLARNRQPAICVYDIRLLSGTMMMDILRCHPVTLIRGHVHENPYYTPPDEFLAELRSRRARSGGAAPVA